MGEIKTRKVWVAGKPVYVPEQTTAAELKRQALVPTNRQLVVHEPNGSARLVRSGESLRVRDDQYFEDMPSWSKGS